MRFLKLYMWAVSQRPVRPVSRERTICRLSRTYQWLTRMSLSCRWSMPTLAAMDMSLSFTTTTRGTSACPASFSASKAMPPVSAPSPISATATPSSPRSFMARAMPSAAEMEVVA